MVKFIFFSDGREEEKNNIGLGLGLLIVIGFIILVVILENAYAHPDILGAKITYEDGHLMDYEIIGHEEKNKEKDAEPVEFLSESWIWENFILLLSLVICLTMIITVFVVCRDELPLSNKH